MSIIYDEPISKAKPIETTVDQYGREITKSGAVWSVPQELLPRWNIQEDGYIRHREPKEVIRDLCGIFEWKTHPEKLKSSFLSATTKLDVVVGKSKAYAYYALLEFCYRVHEYQEAYAEQDSAAIERCRRKVLGRMRSLQREAEAAVLSQVGPQRDRIGNWPFFRVHDARFIMEMIQNHPAFGDSMIPYMYGWVEEIAEAWDHLSLKC